jgi:hypothetical protein
MSCRLYESKQNTTFYLESDKLWEESTDDWRQYLRKNGIPVENVRKTIYNGRGRLVIETSSEVDPSRIDYLAENNEAPVEEHYYHVDEEIKLNPIPYSWEFDKITIESGCFIRVEGEIKDEQAWEIVVIEGQHDGKRVRVSLDEWMKIQDNLTRTGEFMIDNPADNNDGDSKSDSPGSRDDSKKDARNYTRVSDDWPDLDKRDPLGKFMKGSPVTDQFFDVEYDEPEQDDEQSPPEDEGEDE